MVALWLRTLLAALVLLLVTACGGGGGGGGTSSASSTPNPGAPPPPPPPSTFSLSGSVVVAAGTAVDTDLNDPDAAVIPNDTLTAAPPLSNPVTLGGYVNQPGFGPPGRSFVAGDLRDYYRVVLAGGDQVQLHIAEDPVANDLDLALFALDGSPVATSDGQLAVESVRAPADGEYLIEVVAFAGASNYVLTVGGPIATSTAGPEPEFVPGEVIVRLREAAALAPGTVRLDEQAERVGLIVGRGAAEGETLFRCSDERTAFEALNIAHLRSERDPSLERLGEPERMRRQTRRLAKALRRRADVLTADLNYIRRVAAEPTDPLYPLQWHFSQIQLPDAWDSVAPNSGTVVAVIDTGIASGHPDLQGQIVAGYDFIQDTAVSRDGDGCDADPDDLGDGLNPGESSFHGTYVAGLIAARSSLQPGADAAGVSGAAWNARVMPLRALGLGGGTDFDLIQAIRYAAGLDNACNVTLPGPVDVINMSLGGAGQSSALDAAIQEARNAGVIIVSAAGNFATDQPSYPGASPGVISVAATDITRDLALYSNFGPTIDLAAPGGELQTDLNGDGFADAVLSTGVDDTSGSQEFVYLFQAGTSAAAPHVAAVIALMRGVNPALTPADIDALLAAGRMTQDLGDPNRFGYGLINAAAAVTAALQTPGGSAGNAPLLEVSPAELNFGLLGIQADLALVNTGGTSPPLAISALEATTDDGAPWLSVAPLSLDGSGLGSYRVSVDRTQIRGDGIYTGTITFRSNANDVAVPVAVQVGPITPGLDAGRHFVLLLDPVTQATLAAVAVKVSNGSYAFRFENVDPGDYLLLAGSDPNNDGVVCGDAEACGGYPTLSQLAPVRVSGADLGALDFTTSFTLP